MDANQFESLLEKLDLLFFLLQTILLCSACSCGVLTLILIIYAKNQRNLI